MSMLIYKLDVDKDNIYTVIQKNTAMSRKCELTGKSPLKGHKVSHANNKTKRKFLPNLTKVTFVSNILKKNIKLKVTNSALRSVDKKGSIDSFLKDIKFVNLSPRVKKIKKIINSKKLIQGSQMNKLFLSLSFFMGAVVLASNYLVQFPIKYYGLEEILTYGAFSYPVAFLITDLANRRYGKLICKKNCLFWVFLGSTFNTLFFNKFF